MAAILNQKWRQSVAVLKVNHSIDRSVNQSIDLLSPQTFLNQFQAAKDQIAAAGDKMAESAREQAQALHDKAMRLGLHVTMKAPVIGTAICCCLISSFENVVPKFGF